MKVSWENYSCSKPPTSSGCVGKIADLEEHVWIYKKDGGIIGICDVVVVLLGTKP